MTEEPKTETASGRAKRAWVTRKRNLELAKDEEEFSNHQENKIQALFQEACSIVPERKLREALAHLIVKHA